MLRVLGLFVMCISVYDPQTCGLDLHLSQAFLVGALMFFSDPIFSLFVTVHRKNTAANYPLL